MAASSSSPSTRHPEFRKDLVNNKWVIFSPARSKRPSDLKSKSPATNHQIHECPFCVGHESECAPEIFRVPPGSESDWRIRVIQNLYPALSREIEFDPGVGDSGLRILSGAGFGFHDVVIETPTHPVHLSDLPSKAVGDVILAYKQRVLQLAAVEGIKYIQAADLGSLLKLMLQKISTQLNDPPFNYMIHTSLLHIDDSYLPSTHWFLQIIPQLTVSAGFEVGTGAISTPCSQKTLQWCCGKLT